MDEYKSTNSQFAGNNRILRNGRKLPIDFTADDVEIAECLNSHFDIQNEDLPPLYAQTLLSGQSHAVADDDLETRVQTGVFQSLGLNVSKHPLIPNEPARKRRVIRKKTIAQRAVLAVMSLALIISLNSLFSGTAFASMLDVLSGHTGALFVRSYPTKIAKSAPANAKIQPDHRILFQPNWAGNEIDGYHFVGMDVYDAQWWTVGGLMTLQYVKTDATGVHQLTILQFLPKNQVALQVVQSGSSEQIPVGSSNGVFVAGHWVRVNGTLQWESGERAELISGNIGQQGLVTWIAVDNISSAVPVETMKPFLVSVAKKLSPFQLADLANTLEGIKYGGGVVSIGADQPFGYDVIALTPDAALNSNSMIFIRIDSITNSGTDPNQNIR